MSQSPEELLARRSENAAEDVVDVDWEGWSPPEGVVTHAGLPIAADMDFFATPPPEIGEIRSAFSTLKTDQRPLSPFARGAILFGPPSLVVGGMMLAKIDEPAIEILICLVWLPLAWYFTRFIRKCSFVGVNGIARVNCKGNRHKIDKREMFLFQDACDLRTSQTRMYHNGVYTGTTYSFIWSDPQGRKAFKLNGFYMGEKKPPKPKDPFHFAESAETWWSVWLLNRAQEELERQGSIRFRLGGENFVAVGPGFIELGLKGNVQPLRSRGHRRNLDRRRQLQSQAQRGEGRLVSIGRGLSVSLCFHGQRPLVPPVARPLDRREL